MALGWISDSSRELLGLMAEGLATRALGRTPTGEVRPYCGTSFATLAHACLVGERRDEPGLHPSTARARCVQLALTTSDFPKLVGGVFEKVLVETYRAKRASYRLLCRPVELSNFKPTQLYAGGDFPAPLEVGESGEVKRGAMTEHSESIAAKPYSRLVSLSLPLLVADDVDALANLARKAGERLADFENRLFFDQCILPGSGLGPVLADSQTFFHSTHANVATAGALDAAKLSEARALLKAQTTPDGVQLNTDAAYLLVAPAKLGAAEALVAALALAVPEERRIEVVADAALGSSTRFYVVADPAAVPSFAHATIGGPRTISQAGWETLGVDVRLSLDVAFAPMDYRGAVTGAGA